MQAMRIPLIGEVPTPFLAIVALVAFSVVGILMVAHRHRLGLTEPVILRRGHLFVAAVALVVVGGFAMTVSLIGRHNLNLERDARLEVSLQGRTTQAQLDALEARLEQDRMRGERKLRRTFNQRISTSLQEIKDCGRSGKCRVGFARLIRTVVRADPATGDIVPAPPRRGPPIVVAPRPVVPPKVVTVPGPAGKDGRDGKDGVNGKPGEPVDSALLDGLDNRLADVEHGLAQVLGRLPGIDKLLGLLCKALPLVCR